MAQSFLADKPLNSLAANGMGISVGFFFSAFDSGFLCTRGLCGEMPHPAPTGNYRSWFMASWPGPNNNNKPKTKATPGHRSISSALSAHLGPFGATTNKIKARISSADASLCLCFCVFFSSHFMQINKKITKATTATTHIEQPTSNLHETETPGRECLTKVGNLEQRHRRDWWRPRPEDIKTICRVFNARKEKRG